MLQKDLGKEKPLPPCVYARGAVLTFGIPYIRPARQKGSISAPNGFHFPVFIGVDTASCHPTTGSKRPYSALFRCPSCSGTYSVPNAQVLGSTFSPRHRCRCLRGIRHFRSCTNWFASVADRRSAFATRRFQLSANRFAAAGRGIRCFRFIPGSFRFRMRKVVAAALRCTQGSCMFRHIASL